VVSVRKRKCDGWLEPAVGWVVLETARGVCTIRWRRGDPVAHVLDGRQVGELSVAVLGTIPVSPQGWTDVAEIRTRGRAWCRAHHDIGLASVW